MERPVTGKKNLNAGKNLTLLLEYIIGAGPFALEDNKRIIKFLNCGNYGIIHFHFVKYKVVYNLRKNDHQIMSQCRGASRTRASLKGSLS